MMKIILSLCLSLCLIYLAAYAFSTLREEKNNRELAQGVHALRTQDAEEQAVKADAMIPPQSTAASQAPAARREDEPTAQPHRAEVAGADTEPEAAAAPEGTRAPQAETQMQTVMQAEDTPKPAQSAAPEGMRAPQAEAQMQTVMRAEDTPKPAQSAAPEGTGAPQAETQMQTVMQAEDTPKPAQSVAPEGTDESAGMPEQTAGLQFEQAGDLRGGEEDLLLAHYRGLAQRNPDMIGWIHIEGTAVDYPVMYRPEEKDYYLHRGFDGEYAFEGVPFMDERCDPYLPSDNLIIYGHNMRNGSLFGSLKHYLEEEYYLAHPTIYFDTLERRGEYRVFAVIPIILDEMEDEKMRCYGVSMTQDALQVDMLRAYVEHYAVHSTMQELPKPGGEVITLSTCTGFRDANRLVIMAARVYGEE